MTFPTGGELLNWVRHRQPDDWWPLAGELFAYRISQGETPPRLLQARSQYDWHDFLILHATDERTEVEEVTPISVVTFNFVRWSPPLSL